MTHASSSYRHGPKPHPDPSTFRLENLPERAENARHGAWCSTLVIVQCRITHWKTGMTTNEASALVLVAYLAFEAAAI